MDLKDRFCWLVITLAMLALGAWDVSLGKIGMGIFELGLSFFAGLRWVIAPLVRAK